MAFKTRQELLAELPILIKKSLDNQVDKTVGTPGLHDIIKDIIDSLMVKPAGFPVGSIINWSGSIPNIPTNWVLCDGANGTPNLRDRFVPGATGIYTPGARGGSSSHSHTGSVGGHALTHEEMPSHTHSYDRAIDDRGYNTDNDNSDSPLSDFPPNSNQTGSAGNTIAIDGQPHTHPLSDVSSEVILPPYYALAFIMFKGLGYVPTPGGVTITITDIIGSSIYFTLSDTIANGVNVQWSTDDGTTWTSSAGNSISPRSIGFTPTEGTIFRLQSLDNIYTYSNEFTYVSPTLPKVLNVQYLTSAMTTIDLSWDSVVGATSYKIFVDDVHRATSTTPEGFIISGLDPDTAYNIEVAAFTFGLEGPKSDVEIMSTTPDQGWTCGMIFLAPSQYTGENATYSVENCSDGTVTFYTVFYGDSGYEVEGRIYNP